MLSLGAVKPHGSRVVNLNGVCRSLGCSCCYWHEARVDTGDVGVEGNRLARGIEGRLSDCVVCGRELELHHISNCGCDRVGRVCERSICVSDLDNVDCDSCSKGAADAQGREGESCELHIGDDEKGPDLSKTNECGDEIKASSAVSYWPTIKL